MGTELPFLGAEVSYRDAWRWEVIRHRDALGVVECIPDDVAGEVGLRELVMIREAVPVTLHGIGLSLGSTEGLDPDRVRHVARVAEAVQPPWLSEHIAFTRAGGIWKEGEYLDTHTRAVPEESWSLLEWLAPRTAVRAVIIERDGNLPPFEELLAEVRRAEEVLHASR